MRKTYQKPQIDIMYVGSESLLAGSGGGGTGTGGKAIDGEGAGSPDGTPSTDMDDVIEATSKGGSLWDDWE